MDTYNEPFRAAQGCGLIPADKRTGFFRSPREWQDETEHVRGEPVEQWQERCAQTVCPGYVVSLPQVQEAALCAAWQDKGSLADRLDGLPVTPLLRDSIDIYRGACSEVEQHMMNGGE